MMKKIIWIGPRESDTLYSGIKFEKTITYNGNNTDNNISFSSKINTRINQYNETKWNLTSFLKENLQPYINNKNVVFMFYNPMQCHLLGADYIKNTICCNSRNSMELLRHKGRMRQFANDIIPTVPYIQFEGNTMPETIFKDSKTVVVQKAISSGGYGTSLVTNGQYSTWLKKQNEHSIYIMSPYMENAVPINVHVIIFKDKSIIFPPSHQVLRESNNHFIYIGADYNTNLSDRAYNNIIMYSTKLADAMRKEGYIGVCGIDYMIKDDIPYFLEVNSRFQASTFLLNALLTEENLPSVHQLNMMAFSNEKCPINSFSHFNNPKSFFTVMGENIPCWYSDQDSELPPVIERLIRDGFNGNSATTPDAYLFRVMINRNISWVDKDNNLQIAPNIKPDNFDWEKKIISRYPLALKISLLNQGVSLSKTAKSKLNEIGQIREGVFQSIDIIFENGMIINSPYNTVFSPLSSYQIDFDGKTFILKYLNKKISKITFEKKDLYRNKIATNGTQYGKIAFLATDRLRIQHEFRCKFKEAGVSCKFCSIKMKTGNYSFNDIYEIIDFYLENVEFRHFLIGGGSGEETTETTNILKIAQYIHEKCQKPIYVMSLPPKDVSILTKYKQAGITEIGFNIELFDRSLAKEIMPGKGEIPLKQYENAFEKAVDLWGNKGAVRSLMVLGLEACESFYNGINWLSEHGVMPIISVFRPMDTIYLSNVLPPENEKLEEIYYKALEITKKYNLFPGPDCIDCQNNTLSLPQNLLQAIYTD